MILLIEGEPRSGKTHLARQQSPAMAVYDSMNRAQIMDIGQTRHRILVQTIMITGDHETMVFAEKIFRQRNTGEPIIRMEVFAPELIL